MNTLNSKTNESNKFMYQFTDKLNLKNPNKNMALANLSIYYTWKNIKSEYNNNKFNISAPIVSSVYLMGLTTLNKFKTILSTSLKSMKLLLIILLYKFMLIK